MSEPDSAPQGAARFFSGVVPPDLERGLPEDLRIAYFPAFFCASRAGSVMAALALINGQIAQRVAQLVTTLADAARDGWQIHQDLEPELNAIRHFRLVKLWGQDYSTAYLAALDLARRVVEQVWVATDPDAWWAAAPDWFWQPPPAGLDPAAIIREHERLKQHFVDLKHRVKGGWPPPESRLVAMLRQEVVALHRARERAASSLTAGQPQLAMPPAREGANPEAPASAPTGGVVVPAPRPVPGQAGSVDDRASVERRALAELIQHPGWTNKQIAEAIGCHHKYLSQLEKFKEVRKAMRESGKQQLPHGRKARDADEPDAKPHIEAWDEPEGED